MTSVTALELTFADGDYLFDLKLPQLAELQEKRGCGVFKLYGRVLKGRMLFAGEPVALTTEGEAYAEDLFETIRLGLIGGGSGMVNGERAVVDAILARKLVERYCHAAPLRESWAVAAAILGARIEGFTPPGNGEAGDEPAAEPAIETDGSTSDRSSRTAASSTPTGEALPGGNIRRGSGTGTKPRTPKAKAASPIPT